MEQPASAALARCEKEQQGVCFMRQPFWGSTSRNTKLPAVPTASHYTQLLQFVHGRSEDRPSLHKVFVCSPSEVLGCCLKLLFFLNNYAIKLTCLFSRYLVHYDSYHTISAAFSPRVLEKMKISSKNHKFTHFHSISF